MRVPTRLLVLDNANLDVHCFDGGPVSVIQRKNVPAEWLRELNDFDLLQLMETVGHPDRDLLRSVALICTIVQVEGKLTDARFLEELYVDQMWLLAIALPKGTVLVVPQLQNTIAVLG